jgi:ribonuclease HI
MGADGHSNNTGELQAVAEALLWLKDTERSLSESPVLFCLDSGRTTFTFTALEHSAGPCC